MIAEYISSNDLSLLLELTHRDQHNKHFQRTLRKVNVMKTIRSGQIAGALHKLLRSNNLWYDRVVTLSDMLAGRSLM